MVKSFKRIRVGPCQGTLMPARDFNGERKSFSRDPITRKWDETFVCDDCGRAITLEFHVGNVGLDHSYPCSGPLPK